MAKKKQAEDTPNVGVEVTAGGRRICPDCNLGFRLKELFDQHRAVGCKPAKSDGPTWSETNTDEAADETPES